TACLAANAARLLPTRLGGAPTARPGTALKFTVAGPAKVPPARPEAVDTAGLDNSSVKEVPVRDGRSGDAAGASLRRTPSGMVSRSAGFLIPSVGRNRETGDVTGSESRLAGVSSFPIKPERRPTSPGAKRCSRTTRCGRKATDWVVLRIAWRLWR